MKGTYSWRKMCPTLSVTRVAELELMLFAAEVTVKGLAVAVCPLADAADRVSVQVRHGFPLGQAV